MPCRHARRFALLCLLRTRFAARQASNAARVRRATTVGQASLPPRCPPWDASPSSPLRPAPPPCRSALAKAQLYDAWVQHGRADPASRVYPVSANGIADWTSRDVGGSPLAGISETVWLEVRMWADWVVWVVWMVWGWERSRKIEAAVALGVAGCSWGLAWTTSC